MLCSCIFPDRHLTFHDTKELAEHILQCCDMEKKPWGTLPPGHLKLRITTQCIDQWEDERK